MTDWIKRHKLHLLLLLGLAVGLTYVFLVPPWMHYDEPGHFEHAWLIANQEEWPEKGDYDQYMRREVSASIMEHRFDEYTGARLNLSSIYKPVSILYEQMDDPPLYYFLASLPLRLVKNTDITLQLYVSRLVSLLMFLATIWVSYRVASLLFGAEHPITWMLPAFLIAIPSFVDIMTAVNNDVMAILAFSIFVWASVILLLRGFSPYRLLFLVFSVFLCYFSKSTTWLAIPLSPLVLALSIFRGSKQKFVWIGLAVLLIAIVFSSIDYGQSIPSYFVSKGQQRALLQVVDTQAPSGRFVLKQSEQPFYQILTQEGQRQLRGKPVTFSAWIWADQETDIYFPKIGRLDKTDVVLSDQKIHITTQPTLYSTHFDMPDGEYVAWLSFFGSGSTTVYWDDIALITSNSSGVTGSEGQDYINAVRNGSIEAGLPKLIDLADQIIAKAGYKISISAVYQLFDLKGVGWYLRTTAEVVFKGFWGRFGWGAVPLIGKYAYQALFALSIISGLISSIFILKRFRPLPKAVLFLFLTIVIFQLFLVFARGTGSWYVHRYYPTARYFYTVILPVVMYGVYGIYQLLMLIQNVKILNTHWGISDWGIRNLFYSLGVLAMITWGIISIYCYYV